MYNNILLSCNKHQKIKIKKKPFVFASLNYSDPLLGLELDHRVFLISGILINFTIDIRVAAHHHSPNNVF